MSASSTRVTWALAALAVVALLAYLLFDTPSDDARDGARGRPSGTLTSDRRGPSGERSAVETDRYRERADRSSETAKPDPAAAPSGPTLRGRVVVRPDGAAGPHPVVVAAMLWSDRTGYERGFLSAMHLWPEFLASASGTARTDERWEIPVPDEGVWRLRIGVEGFLNAIVCTALTGEHEEISAESVDRLEFTVRDVDPADVAGVSVRLAAVDGERVVQAVRDEAGEWSLDGPVLLPVWAAVRVRESPRAPAWTRVEQERTDLPAPLRSPTRLAIVDTTTDSAVKGARVRLSGFVATATRRWQRDLVSDVRGEVALPALEGAIDWAIGVTAEGFSPAVLAKDGFLQLPTDARGRRVLALLHDGRPGGRLRDVRGDDLVGARVFLIDGDRADPVMQGRTGPDGRFVLSPGIAMDVAIGGGRAPFRQGDTGVLLVRTADGAVGVLGSVAWPRLRDGSYDAVMPDASPPWLIEVTDGAGPVPDADIRIVPMLDETPLDDLGRDAGRTDLQGRRTVGRLCGGRWRVVVRARGFEPAEVHSGPDEANPLLVRVRRAAPMAIRWVDPRGAPMANTLVGIWNVSDNEDHEDKETDAEGRTRFAAVRGAKYRPIVRKRDHAVSLTGPRFVAAGGPQITITVVERRGFPLVLVGEDGKRPRFAALVSRPIGAGERSGTQLWRAPAPRAYLGLEPQRLAIWAAGFQHHEETVDPREVGPEGLRVHLGPGWTVTGRLMSGSVPEQGVSVIATIEMTSPPCPLFRQREYAASLDASTVSRADGAFRLGPLTPGRWRIGRAGTPRSQHKVVDVTRNVELGNLH